MPQTKSTRVLLAASVTLLGLVVLRTDTTAAELAVPGREVPTFQVDPSWPAMLGVGPFVTLARPAPALDEIARRVMA